MTATMSDNTASTFAYSSGDQERMQCMEVWGGNDLVDANVSMSGLDAWVYSKPYKQAQAGGDVQMWGSASLATALLANGLVDELNLMIEPILLGGGKRIFPDDGTARTLELVSSTVASTGVLVCSYRPAG